MEIAFGAKRSKKAEPLWHDVVGEEGSKGRFSSAILAPDLQIFPVQRLGGAKATIGGNIWTEADGAEMRSKSGVPPAKLTAGISDRIWNFLLVVAVAWSMDMNTEEAEKHLDASGVQLGCYVAVEELMNRAEAELHVEDVQLANQLRASGRMNVEDELYTAGGHLNVHAFCLINSVVLSGQSVELHAQCYFEVNIDNLSICQKTLTFRFFSPSLNRGFEGFQLMRWIGCKSYPYHDTLELHMPGWCNRELAFLLRNIGAKLGGITVQKSAGIEEAISSLENKMWDRGRIKVFSATSQEAIACKAGLRFPIKAQQLFDEIPLGTLQPDTGLQRMNGIEGVCKPYHKEVGGNFVPQTQMVEMLMKIVL
jgi:hypothetical protein